MKITSFIEIKSKRNLVNEIGYGCLKHSISSLGGENRIYSHSVVKMRVKSLRKSRMRVALTILSREVSWAYHIKLQKFN